MSEPNKKTPNGDEWKYPMTSEPVPAGNPRQWSGGDPQAAAAQRAGGGGAPGTGEEMSEEAKSQWAGPKGPAESGKP